MGLTLTVLGCSGSYPAPDLPCSGYLVRSATTAIVLDLGHGAFAELQRHLDVADLDAVVLSHAHPDHWVDLTGLRILTHYGMGLDHVPVWGTDGTRHMLATVASGIEPAFDWHRLGPEPSFTIGDLSLRIERTDHYLETYAIRVDGPDGSSLLYSSDTGPGWSPAELGRDVDLALIESSYLDAAELGDVLHLCADMAGRGAREAGARRLVLTHLVPGADPEAHARRAGAAYGGPVDVASPGAVFAF